MYLVFVGQAMKEPLSNGQYKDNTTGALLGNRKRGEVWVWWAARMKACLGRQEPHWYHRFGLKRLGLETAGYLMVLLYRQAAER